MSSEAFGRFRLLSHVIANLKSASPRISDSLRPPSLKSIDSGTGDRVFPIEMGCTVTRTRTRPSSGQIRLSKGTTGSQTSQTMYTSLASFPDTNLLSRQIDTDLPKFNIRNDIPLTTRLNSPLQATFWGCCRCSKLLIRVHVRAKLMHP